MSVPRNHSPRKLRRRVRYAVVGAGHIAQNAMLPAFRNASRNSLLTAIVSGEAKKRSALRKAYRVEHVFDYEDFDEACQAGVFDAVYIALPNSMHCDFACRAAIAGIHVLCEKPMAVTSAECAKMINAADSARVKLMIAYRLHFEAANLEAVRLVQRGRLGEPRSFSSVFSMQVRPGNIRLDAALGGGPLPDIGIYCINAARYLFGCHPIGVVGYAGTTDDSRFDEVQEMVSAVLRFPGDRLASFTCSFGAADASHYQVVGTKGDLRVDPAYEYEGVLKHRLTLRGKTSERRFHKRDQFAPQLIYFSDCILRGRDPEPGGEEGLADVRIIEAIQESIQTRSAVTLNDLPADRGPTRDQEMRLKPPRKGPLVAVNSARA